MSRWGKVDYKRLIYLQKKLKRLEEAGIEQFFEQSIKEIAARFLRKVIQRTPVGLYEDGRVGGTLRRGWTTKSQRQAELSAVFGGSEVSKQLLDEIKVNRFGPYYEIEIINPVEYASYVEFGHRTRGGKGFVPGRFFMTISANEVEQQASKIYTKRLNKILEEAFSGD